MAIVNDAIEDLIWKDLGHYWNDSKIVVLGRREIVGTSTFLDSGGEDWQHAFTSKCSGFLFCKLSDDHQI